MADENISTSQDFDSPRQIDTDGRAQGGRTQTSNQQQDISNQENDALNRSNQEDQLNTAQSAAAAAAIRNNSLGYNSVNQQNQQNQSYYTDNNPLSPTSTRFYNEVDSRAQEARDQEEAARQARLRAEQEARDQEEAARQARLRAEQEARDQQEAASQARLREEGARQNIIRAQQESRDQESRDRESRDREEAARQNILRAQQESDRIALAAKLAKNEEDRIAAAAQQESDRIAAAAQQESDRIALAAKLAKDEEDRIAAAAAQQKEFSKLQDEINAKAQALAIQMVAAQQAQQAKINTGNFIFKRFNLSTDVIENYQVFKTTGLFSSTINGVLTNASTMSVMFTSSLQTDANKKYYYDAWNANINIDKSAEPQFSVAFGNRLGSGSFGDGTMNDSPSRAVYSQYRLLLLNPNDTTFTFKDGKSTDNIYVINFNRSRIKEKVDPGNWQLTLGQLSGSSVANNVHTGSNVKIATNPGLISLIDDSGDLNENFTATVGRVINVVSGSLLGGIHNPTAPKYYGLLYPDMGMIVLNGDVLNASASFNTVTGSNINGDNAFKLFTSISGAMVISSDNAFQSRNSEFKTSARYFVKINNNEFNFSNNPSFTSGSEGTFLQPTFLNAPKVYITSVGMYNDRQELLAVGKLSKAIQKSFDEESLIKVRLTY